MNEIMTTEDLAKYLHMNRQVVARLAREKKSPSISLAKKWLFKKSVIDKWLEDRIRENISAP